MKKYIHTSIPTHKILNNLSMKPMETSMDVFIVQKGFNQCAERPMRSTSR